MSASVTRVFSAIVASVIDEIYSGSDSGKKRQSTAWEEEASALVSESAKAVKES